MPLTKVTTAITAATPITTPSKVSAERSLFAHSDRNAILIASVMFICRWLALLTAVHRTTGAGFLQMSLAGRGCGFAPGSIHRARVLCEELRDRTGAHALPAAIRIESFTDTNATSSASTVQLAADSIPPCKMSGIRDGKDKDVENCAVVDALPNCAMATTPATRTRTS